MSNKPHPHRDVIIAWANGATIEWRKDNRFLWDVAKNPHWDECYQYRVKPEPKKISYRVGLFNSSGKTYYVEAITNKKLEEYYRLNKAFVHWITDWIEVEVPNED